MYTDHILEEKWRIQKILAQNANYDIDTFINNIHSSIDKLKDEYDLELKYSKRKGGYTKPN